MATQEALRRDPAAGFTTCVRIGFEARRLPAVRSLESPMHALRVSAALRLAFSALFVSPLLLGGCGEEAQPPSGARAGQAGTPTLRPLVCWVARGTQSVTLPGIAMRAGLPP